MTKEKLIQENQELRNQICRLEKEINEVGISHECNRLYEIRDLLQRQIEFYQNVIINLTTTKEEKYENSYQ